MKAKYFLGIAVGMFASTVSVRGQVLTHSLNHPRGGDDVTRHVLPYVPPGSEGREAFWDLSTLTLHDEEERVLFSASSDTAFRVTRPQSVFRYCLTGDTLLCTGYSAPNLEVEYLRPRLALRYPFAYGDSIASFHYGEGRYSHVLNMAVYGQSFSKADAEGVLLLPEGDTLRHVLRVHEHSLLGQRLSPDRGILCLGDSAVFSDDTISCRLRTDSVTWTVDTYRWYAAGYRYPVLESVRAVVSTDLGEHTHFSRTFYHPAFEQAYMEDADNLELRELLALQDRAASAVGRTGGGGNTGTDGFPDGERDGGGYTCDCALSAGGTRLDVEMFFEGEHEVQLQVSTIQGYVIARSPKRRVQGALHETFDLSSARHNVYMLSVILDGEVRSEKVVKQ